VFEIDVHAISRPEVRVFYMLFWEQRRILRDFFHRLPAEQYDFRMVDRPDRQADTPRQSLAHILETQHVFLRGVRSGVLRFADSGVAHLYDLEKEALLAELERLDREMYALLTHAAFDSTATVQAPWGELDALNLLYFLRDHDILHIGWNLALMDHLALPRYASLNQYWGSGEEEE